MNAKARRTDPKTSHAAARVLTDSGIHGRQKLAALRLVRKYEGYTYRHLYDRHVAECKKRERDLVFQDAPSLMRRLSEVAYQEGVKFCPISGRRVSRWWAK